MNTENDTTILEVRVTPSSSKKKIYCDKDGSIKVFLHSPPIDGKANAECIALFSKILKIAKSRIEIDKGAKGRNKRVIIYGMDRKNVLDKIVGLVAIIVLKMPLMFWI